MSDSLQRNGPGADPDEQALHGSSGLEAETLVINAISGAGERLDRFLAKELADRFDGISRSRIQKWIALGAVTCTERQLSPSTRLSGFESLLVNPLPREADAAFEPDPVAIPIIDEDLNLLIIDKPAGLVVHPAPGNWRNTLLNGLLHHRPKQRELPRAGIVHRLDKDTSGLMVVARTERALGALVTQLADRSMSRRYLAVALGDVPAEIEVDEPLGRDPRSRLRMAVVNGPTGKPARTSIRRLARLRVDGVAASLVECRLHTGRTHQIRVHMRHIGHPLLGDGLYGGPMGAISRQALHAWRLGLADPGDGSPRFWSSPPPPDFHGLVNAAGGNMEEVLDDLADGLGR